MAAHNDYAEEKKKEIQDIYAKLEQGVKDVFDSDNYKKYLSVMSTFHKYSVSNTLLIMLQNPNATLVAGYDTWQKRKRQVMKHEKGIRILAPQNYTLKTEKDIPLKDSKGAIVLDESGKPVTVKKQVDEKRIRFVPVSVFDVSQTSGEPLPRLVKVSELNGTVPERDIIIQALNNVAGIPLSIVPIEGNSKGYYDSFKKIIAVREGMSDAHTLKTGIHEVAHKLLHDPEKDILAATDTRNMKEVQAESVAFIVANHLGLDTSDYSFGYIASWSTGKEINELKASLTSIQRAAEAIINEIDKALENMRSVEKENTAYLQDNKTEVSSTIANTKVSDLPEDIKDREAYLYDKTMDRLKSIIFDFNNIVSQGEPISNFDFKSQLETTSNLINIHMDGWGAEPSEKLSSLQESINDIIKDMGLNGMSANDAAISVTAICDIHDNTLIYKSTIEKLKELNANYYESVNTAEPMWVDKYIDILDDINAKIYKDLNGKQPTDAVKELSDALSDITADNIRDIHNGVYPTEDSLMKRVESLYEKPSLLEKPVVTINWSENKDFKSNEKYSLAVIDEKIARYDRKVVKLKEEAKAKGDYYPYFKTEFQIDFPLNGQNHTYTGRQDIGDGDGGLIQHIKEYAEFYLKPEQAEFIQSEEHKQDLEWILSTFVPYLEKEKEIEVMEKKLEYLIAEKDLEIAHLNEIKDKVMTNEVTNVDDHTEVNSVSAEGKTVSADSDSKPFSNGISGRIFVAKEKAAIQINNNEKVSKNRESEVR